ncbi:MAG: hypothetical protein PVH84_02170 [Candidatus Aminicenantes bacterium]|jgi:hypothetical protein
MYFKKKYQIQRSIGIFQKKAVFFALAGIFSLSQAFGQDEVVDRIVALVNGQVITLTDVRVARAFGLYDKEGESRMDESNGEILQKLIDRKLVIQMTRDDASVKQEEMEAFLDKISAEMGNERFREELDKFGMQRGDLGPYAYEEILFKRILSSRFDRTVPVTLEEIQAFYETRYLPDQRDKGFEPQSMLDIFDDIEAMIRKEKSEKQIEEWLQNLREKAEIQLNLTP